MSHDTVLHGAAHWLLHSGIQAPSGGVARFYRTDQRRNAPISTEITGYAASAFAFLHSATGLPGLSERLHLTADYLALAWNPALSVFPFEMEDGQSALAYFFDSGIILRGLLAASRHLPLVLPAAQGMLRRFGAGAGIHPVIELPGCRPLPREPRWSRLPGCYQLKSALVWQASSDASLRQAWDDTLAASLASHECFLPGAAEPARVMDRLHAYCYFLEALLDADQPAVLAAGMARVASMLQAIAPEFVRSDVYAQLLRLRLLAAPAVPLDTVAASREATELLQFQAHGDDPAIHGGFWFGRNREGLLPFVNPVSTIFAAQALHFWATRQKASVI